MTATTNDLQEWFRLGKATGFDRLVVVCDTYDWSDYPVYMKDEDFWERFPAYNQNMQKVMEVYDLHGDEEKQLSERRAFYLPD